MSKDINKYGTKEEKIRYFLEKGPEWMAKQLWLARKENYKLREDYNKEARGNRGGLLEKYAVQEANERLKDVLSQNGIKPVRYILNYIIPCVLEDGVEEPCEAFDRDITECDDCQCKTEGTGSFSFYDFSIEDGWIEALDERFEKFGCSVLSMRNEQTGAIIYKRERGSDGQSDD